MLAERRPAPVFFSFSSSSFFSSMYYYTSVGESSLAEPNRRRVGRTLENVLILHQYLNTTKYYVRILWFCLEIAISKREKLGSKGNLLRKFKMCLLKYELLTKIQRITPNLLLLCYDEDLSGLPWECVCRWRINTDFLPNARGCGQRWHSKGLCLSCKTRICRFNCSRNSNSIRFRKVHTFFLSFKVSISK